MKTLELYAGSQSFSKVAKELGYQTFTTDILNLKGIDYVTDILNFDVSKVPFVPDIIWASPDCSTWSMAAGTTHFSSKSLIPKTEKAKQAFVLIDKTFEIIDYYLRINPRLLFYVENPVGKLRFYLELYSKPNFFNEKRFNIPRTVAIDQCQYGRQYKKPTHIFTNDMQWRPRPRCKGSQHCEHLPNIQNSTNGRRSSLGILGNCGYYKRAEIAQGLIFEILNQNHGTKNQTIN